MGISATIGLSESLAVTDPLLARFVSSILTVESRHGAFFRQVQGIVPNPAPFDTGISDIWAYNAAQAFIVPGSCPVEIPVPVLPGLKVSRAAISTNGTVLQQFTWDPTQSPFVVEGHKQLFAGWVNQVNKPVYTPLNSTTSGKGIASMPQGMNGIAFAVITAQQYGNVKDLAWGTMAGPALVPLS